MTIQLEYINHLLQFFKNIFYHAAIMLNASLTYYAQNYSGIIGWSLTLLVFLQDQAHQVIPCHGVATCSNTQLLNLFSDTHGGQLNSTVYIFITVATVMKI